MILKTLLDILKNFPNLKNKTAVKHYTSFRTFSYTYEDLFKKISSACLILKKLGLKKGDRIVLWGEDSFYWIVYYWACVALGLQVLPIDVRYDESFVKEVLSITNSKAIIFGEKTYQYTNKFNDFKKILYQEIEEIKDGISNFEAISQEEVVQIIFTSGTTSKPKGVIQRHINICSSLNPIVEELQKYKPYLKLLGQIKVLSLLPLTHMFGQAISLFILPLIEGALIISDKIDPKTTLEIVKKEKVHVIACVPWFIKQFKLFIQRRFCLKDEIHFFDILKIRKQLGFRFLGFVTGGAFLDKEIEMWWRKLKFLIIQGYGLTEASPIVALNHPLNSKPGSIGKGLKNLDIKLSEEGEILVKGKNVCKEFITSEGKKILKEDWLPTGDIGYIDNEGRLYFKGRKKDVIVLSSGENVYPEDVENVLRKIKGVKDCSVVGLKKRGEEEVHAVLILEENSDTTPENIILKANKLLKPHQRVKSWTLWPYKDFPRTPTYKVKKREVLEVLSKKRDFQKPKENKELKDLISRIKGIPKDLLRDNLRLREDLFFSSIEYVELACALEESLGKEVDISRLSEVKSIKDLEKTLIELEKDNPQKSKYINWRWSLPIRFLRGLWINLFLIPFFKLFINLKIEKIKILNELKEPHIIVANHTSHLDIIVIMMSLPFKIRNFIIPLITSLPFKGYLGRGNILEKFVGSIKYFLVGFLFNAVPISFDPKDVKKSLILLGKGMEKGFWPVIFPEGRRSENGRIKPFMPGVAFLSKKLNAKVLPIFIKGTKEILPIGSFIPKHGEVKVKFLEPLKILYQESINDFTQRLEESFLKEENNF